MEIIPQNQVAVARDCDESSLNHSPRSMCIADARAISTIRRSPAPLIMNLGTMCASKSSIADRMDREDQRTQNPWSPRSSQHRPRDSWTFQRRYKSPTDLRHQRTYSSDVLLGSLRKHWMIYGDWVRAWKFSRGSSCLLRASTHLGHFGASAVFCVSDKVEEIDDSFSKLGLLNGTMDLQSIYVRDGQNFYLNKI